MQYKHLLFVALITIVIYGCQHSFDSEQARDEILALHRSFVEVHLAKDVSAIVRPIPDDYLFVAYGDVQTLNGSEVQKKLQSYLDATTFSHYEDTNEPIIGFSKDGSLAWSIVQVRVAGTTHKASGSDDPFDIKWAWISLYEKRNGEWSLKADISTNRPFTKSE